MPVYERLAHTPSVEHLTANLASVAVPVAARLNPTLNQPLGNVCVNALTGVPVAVETAPVVRFTDIPAVVKVVAPDITTNAYPLSAALRNIDPV